MGQDELDNLRERIDGLDDELLEILARRMETVKAIGRYKQANGLPYRDDERLKSLLEDRLKKAGGLELDPGLVDALFRIIHEYALKAEAGD